MKKIIFIKDRIIIILFLLGISTSYALAGNKDFTLAEIIQSKMVIQQAKPFKLWGTAPVGSKITIKADWAKSVSVVAQKGGSWIAEVNVPAAIPGDFKAHIMTVQSGDTTVVLNDLLIGEVWLCSGQSNMTMYMKPFKPWHYGVINYKTEIEAANFQAMRLFTVQKDSSLVPGKRINGSWEICTPKSVEIFSAVSYYFGRELFTNINIPIGLVVSGYGGAACQAFTSKEVLAADPLLKREYLDPFEKGVKKGVTGQPALIYNAMIYPLRNLSMRGIIWYQGESNAGKRGLYPSLCGAMITGWRELFKQGDLPFYFVQMPAYNWKKHNPYEFGYALFREEQQSLLKIKNTGMAVTIDVGDTTIVHPSRKKEVGERLGKIALHNLYNKNLIYEGPKFSSMTIEKNKVVIAYVPESIGSGLTITEGSEPLHFFMAGNDKKFYPAKAMIENNKIILQSDRVLQPVAVRYAFTTYPFTNFGNKEGLPAYPFRTDDWTGAKMLP